MYPPSAVLSGSQGYRWSEQRPSGIKLENGDAYLVKSVVDAEVHLVGRPNFPNLESDEYTVHLWADWDGGAEAGVPRAHVIAEPVKARVTLSGASVAPGASITQTVNVPGAKPGDVVSLGAPPDLPASVVFSGVVVADDTVEIRLFNPNTAATEDASGLWYVTAGNGLHAGDPQIVGTAAEAEPPWPNPPLPA